MYDRSAAINDNIGLVRACAGRFKGKGIEYDDLYQAGCVGLVKAADRFDPSRGFCFSTYAVPVIIGEIKRIFRDGGAVRVSRGLKETGLKIARFRESFASEHGREPAVSEIAAALDISEEQVSEAVCAAAPTVSLSAPEDGDRELEIPVESDDVRITELISLRQELGRLREDDRQLLIKRFFENKTQSVTAREMGMTQVQVSRKEKKILGELRIKLAV